MSLLLKAPYGIVGKIACKLFLVNYMTRLLQQRNLVIKEYAETASENDITG
jgi:hypothetical protein